MPQVPPMPLPPVLSSIIIDRMQRGFAEQTKKVIKGTSSNHARYWRSLDTLEDSQNIYHFCMKMFESLISSSKDQFLDDDHEAMYATLLVLQFYKNTKLKSEKWLEETVKTFEENKPKLFENAKWIVTLYIKNYEESQFALNFLGSLTLIPQKFSWEVQPGAQIEQALKQAKDYFDIIELKKKDKPYKKLSHMAYPPTIKQSKIAAYAYCCFLDYLRSVNYQPKKKLWLQLVDNLKGMVHSLRYTSKGYQLLAVLLYFTSNLITYYGCVYQEILKELIYYANVLRSSPGIIAQMAYDLFFTIHGELKCPGTAFRKEIRRRFVNLDLKKAEILGSTKYLITFKRLTLNSPQHCSLNNLRKLIIYNVLGSCKIDTINKLWAMLQPLDVETTFAVYYKVMKIIQIASNLETYQSIQKLIKDYINELFKIGWAPYKKIRKEEQAELQNLVIDENVQRLFQFPNFEIIPVKPENLVNPQYEYSIQEQFQAIRQQPYNEFFYSNFLQYIFIGNDEQFSQVLNRIGDFLVQVPPKQYQKLAFYIVPVRQGDCYLAEYLSYKDIWYRRYLFNVFREKTIFPYVSIDDPEIKDTFPSYLFTKTLHMYIREARRKVPIQIFQVSMESTNGAGNRTVYFVNNLLMGVSMECETMKNDVKKEKKSFPDGLETYLEKVKKVYPISVDIEVRYKEPGSNLMLTQNEKFLNVEDLQICNTPRPYFFGYKPNPLSEYIQLSILTVMAARVFKSELQSRQNFKRHSDVEIYEAFRDLFINLSAQTIVISRSQGMKDPLRMLIDGVEYNDIQRMKISAAYTHHKPPLPLTLPVRGFLPFEA